MKGKKLMSMVTAGALAVTMVMPVMAADTGTVDVDVATKSAVLRVTVPTSLAVAVDQFEMTDKGTQIYSGDFTMENNSAIAVKVDITSTADLKAETKLLGSKAAAESSTAAGEAWLAVAAQTSNGKYIEDAAKGIGDLTEDSENVTTFVQGTGEDAAKGKASQTFFLKKASTAAYKLLNANESAADISYAQFYELTAKTVADANALAALIKDNDVYVATAAATDGQSLTLVAKGGTHTYASGEIYYTADATATAKASIDASKLYVYADGTADTDGKAAFRYIGNLSGAQEEWSATDITDVHINYSIVGVRDTRYDEVKDNCTYGLYQEPIVFTAGATKGTITYATSDVSEVTKIEMTNERGTFDAMVDKGSTYSKATIAESNGTTTITLNSKYMSFYSGKVDATITYKDASGATKTEVLELDMDK